MSDTAPKRFWEKTSIAEVQDGYAIELDGRPLRTPSKAELVIASAALAEAVRAEWDAQDTHIRPETMPMTRYLNSAIDRVAPAFEAVVDTVAAYGETDLLCYRAGHPQELVTRQADLWDPILVWARDRYEAPLILAEGVIHVEQPAQSLARLRAAVADRDAISLAALHELTALSGSLVLALAVDAAHLEAERAWALSRLDEDWQAEQWGSDEEAEQAAHKKRADFMDAARLMRLL